MSAIDIFRNISLKYQRQLRKQFHHEILEKLSDHLSEEDMLNVIKTLNIRVNKSLLRKKKEIDNTEHAQNVNRSNLLKYVIRELKENMSKSTPIDKRNRIAQRVINEMNHGKTFEEAKDTIYKKYKIFISYQVGHDNDRTNHENMNIEREHDEYSGKNIYGWDDNGEVLYEPTFGAFIDPPSFKEGGPRWREILDHRWEKLSSYEDDETIDSFKG